MFNISMVQPVSALAVNYGAKAIVYGGPGTGKTPLCTSAPYPIIAFAEPGLGSVRVYNGPGVITDTYAKMRDFWQWATQSAEARQFQTKCADSISQMAEIVLAEEKVKNKDPRKAYGEMSSKMMEILNWIYYCPHINALLIAKEDQPSDENGKMFRPFFPGKDLNVKVPHLYDAVWRLEMVKQPNGTEQRVIRTRSSFNAFARYRFGNLNEIEAADIAYLFNKMRQ